MSATPTDTSRELVALVEASLDPDRIHHKALTALKFLLMLGPAAQQTKSQGPAVRARSRPPRGHVTRVWGAGRRRSAHAPSSTSNRWPAPRPSSRIVSCHTVHGPAGLHPRPGCSAYSA